MSESSQTYSWRDWVKLIQNEAILRSPRNRLSYELSEEDDIEIEPPSLIKVLNPEKNLKVLDPDGEMINSETELNKLGNRDFKERWINSNECPVDDQK